MIGKVTTKDGQKIVEPISGSIPTGNPVGTLLATYKKLQPRNYLYCDGSTFNASQYPALYLYLGSNVLPDYRECVMVGAEENTTDNIATHDVYAQGEFKDDQTKTAKIGVQDGASNVVSGGNGTILGGENVGFDGTFSSGSGSVLLGAVGNYSGGNKRVLNINNGTTTHGKQKAVYVYIKAVDGVDISDEDTFLVTVKNFVDERVTRAESYSTEEQWTGGYWIDGKKIYRICNNATGSVSISQAGTGTIPMTWFIINIKTDVDKILKVSTGQNGCSFIDVWRNATLNATGVNVKNGGGDGYGISATTTILLEYTKTTD